MASRTQIVCLHEGKKGRSIDPLFINAFLKRFKPNWIRPWPGTNIVRPVDCGGRTELIERMPTELRLVLGRGASTTLMVWADLDHDMPTCLALKNRFWAVAQEKGISQAEFDQVVFAFAKDRLENWIEFLSTGTTNESVEGVRVKHSREAVDAGRALADRCRANREEPPLPRSLKWSCLNWQALAQRMASA
ncbi:MULTISPECIES: hypothetical protein [unclassified Thiocapsa]|uniref:hypothetical protein n=1 Tax=unclassified Thiocapsa TaxID=2641286 RepID=UPI0035B020FC